MKKSILLLIALILCSFCATAQSLDNALNMLEEVKREHGEQSQEYLSALDSVVLQASIQKNFDTALFFRHRHYEILKEIKGETSVEIVSDLMRLGNTYYVLGDFALGETCYQTCCEVLKLNGLKESKAYFNALFRVFECASIMADYIYVSLLSPTISALIDTYSDYPEKDAYSYSSKMYDASLNLGKYDDALYYCNEAYRLDLQLNGQLDYMDLADYSFKKAIIYALNGEQQKALSYIYEGKTNASKSQHPVSQIIRSRLLALESMVVIDYNEALLKSDSALLVCKEFVNEINERMPESPLILMLQADYADRLLDKSRLLVNHGRAAEASAVYEQYSSLCEELNLSVPGIYFSLKNNIAMSQMEMGNYSDAINTLNELKFILESISGTDSRIYTSTMLNFASYYDVIGDNDKALKCTEIAAEISKRNGYDHEYAVAIANLGAGYSSKGGKEDLEKAMEYLVESIYLDSIGGYFGKDLHMVYHNMSNVSYKLGNTKEGKEYYEKAKQLTESIYGKRSVEYAKLISSEGLVLYKNRDINAFDLYKEAAETMIAIGNKTQSNYLQSLIEYGLACFTFNKTTPTDYCELIIEAVETYYKTNMQFYMSIDRMLMWRKLSNVKDLVFSVRTDSELDESRFNYVLFSKSLMNSTSDQLKNAVYKTGDPAIINQYNNILSVQTMIDNQSFGISSETQSSALYERKASLERDLISRMKALGYSVNEGVTYNDIRSTLKDNEIAIEFEEFDHLKDSLTFYVALLAKSSWDKPVYVQLCTEDELKACLGNPNVTYSTDDLYRLLWQPLLEYVGDSSTVYFSPSGMLHTIALESLHTPDGSCLSDKYNLVRLTSTRELCKEKQPKTYETGAIYGGLQYDVEQQRMAKVAEMTKVKVNEGPVFAQKVRGEDRGNWKFLPGTLEEVEHIVGIMRKANIECKPYEGDLGSEESFKALSGGNTDIIHLATHGYFLEGEKADMNDFMKSLSPLARQKTDSVIDPLLRSGLILSGGNSAWLGKGVPEGIEDGVLTALEISTMNLSGTDMVVMSACETGLGDIASDGVFGLQRAFKMAGVQTLVMSLWKVDDNATSLMMQTFYEHLLSGISKREAFNLAQAAVRAKYPEPYYWAGFVMLD